MFIFLEIQSILHITIQSTRSYLTLLLFNLFFVSRRFINLSNNYKVNIKYFLQIFNRQRATAYLSMTLQDGHCHFVAQPIL